LADTRGIDQDQLHKESIAFEIKKHINSVNAILILANGTVPRMNVVIDYALTTLSTIFPNTLANNIAFMFTNVPNRLTWNFSEDTIPATLKHAGQFLLNNPIALQNSYLKIRDGPVKKKLKMGLRKAVATVQNCEQDALDMLVNLFDWLDGLEPRPTTEIISLYDMSQNIEAMITDTLAQMEQGAAKKAAIDELVTAPKDKLKVSSSLCSYWDPILCSLNIGYECFLPLRAHCYRDYLEATGHIHRQYDMRRDQLLF